MKLPVKDPVTIPWMAPREIPAIKAVLSAWRKLRKDRTWVADSRWLASSTSDPHALADDDAAASAELCERIAAIDEHLRKEAKKCK